MKMDRTTVIGMILLGILFFTFFWYTSKQQEIAHLAQKRIDDSLARVAEASRKPLDEAAVRLDSLRRDSASKLSAAGNFSQAAIGSEKLTTVENNVMKVVFTNKGGTVKSVVLKNYRSMDSSLVELSGGNNDALGYTINTAANQASETSDLYFSEPELSKNDSSTIVTYRLTDVNGQGITHQFRIKNDNFLINWNIGINNPQFLLSQNSLNLHWKLQMHQQQLSHVYESQQSRLAYYVRNDGYDYNSAASGVKEDFKKPLNWLSFKQQFFNTTIISANGFNSGSAQMTLLPDTSGELFNATASLKLEVPTAANANIPLQLFYGPNDYHILKQYNEGLENIVDYGSGVFSFVKYINRFIILPVFNFLASIIGHYGWVIALLTLFIRLVTAPLTYKSYLSGAKMRVLRPELDAVKKKFGDDKQGFAMEQMKLFKEAGVNPLGGCMPSLLQIPIFFALYSFFSSNIDLRGQSFLWAKDLSSYDVIATLPFSIPFGFGDHVSLFTLTAVATSFLISFYNMSMTPTQDNPAMKYMPYIFPFVLLFVFNRLPSALTWYYTVSNIITLGIQFVIQNYILDHDKILAQIEAKRKEPKKVNKFQERYAQMMEQQKKLQDMKTKASKKK